MIVIAMASQKGGSGKTTLSGHMAVEAEKAGAGPVALIDTDPQGSLSHWWNARAARSPHFAKVGAFELESALAHLARTGTKLAIIDTPPAISESISEVIAHADLVIVPTRPSPHDLRAVGATVDMAERLAKPLIFVVNAATPRARITGEAAVALSQHGTVAPVTIHHRVDFAASMVDGRTVGEAVPKSASAKETADLWLYIQDRLARLTKDVMLAPEVKPQHFSLAPLSAVDGEVVEMAEPVIAEVLEPAPPRRPPLLRRAPVTPDPLPIPSMAEPPVMPHPHNGNMVVNGHSIANGSDHAHNIAHETDVNIGAVNTNGEERRSGKDRRDPNGSTLFAGPERRANVFGRRNADYETSGRK